MALSKTYEPLTYEPPHGVEEVFTWHHHENGKTMMLVEQAVHNSVQHIGGAALIKSGAVSMLDYDLILPGPVF